MSGNHEVNVIRINNAQINCGEPYKAMAVPEARYSVDFLRIKPIDEMAILSFRQSMSMFTELDIKIGEKYFIIPLNIADF